MNPIPRADSCLSDKDLLSSDFAERLNVFLIFRGSFAELRSWNEVYKILEDEVPKLRGGDVASSEEGGNNFLFRRNWRFKSWELVTFSTWTFADFRPPGRTLFFLSLFSFSFATERCSCDCACWFSLSSRWVLSFLARLILLSFRQRRMVLLPRERISATSRETGSISGVWTADRNIRNVPRWNMQRRVRR